MQTWQTSRREIPLEKTLIMGILNVTPDSFSDGGKFADVDNALKQTEKMIREGMDILDIGGESTRPNSERVSESEEIRRIIPVIEEISKRFDIPISIDTSKSNVAQQAINAGAEIINDISGLHFDEQIGKIAATQQAGLILMHLRGDFETMHKQPAVENILIEVSNGFRSSIAKARKYNVNEDQIVLDVGIGFSKTFGQNLELIAKLDKIISEFPNYPIMVGTSRKSFIGKILNDSSPERRLHGSLASEVIAVWNGAKILRVHDVRETIEAIKIVEAIKKKI